jgi:ribosomal protein S18 acetylase RimI-like enzyme
MHFATSKWVQYIQERESTQVYETEEGFATYKINGLECYLSDIYVLPEFRKQNIASKMADQIAIIAKEQGCKYLLGSVCPTANNADTSLRVLQAYGMRLVSAKDNIIYMVKDL